MKLKFGLNFIYVLHTAFEPADPKIIKSKLFRQYIFPFLGSAGVKAAHITLMKLTLGQVT